VVTGLLVLGTKESAIVNSILVAVKLVALSAFIFLSLPNLNMDNFTPFAPYGYGSTEIDGISRGVMAAAALIFFAYVGFDAVSTAAEETKNPNRNVPLGLIGSLGICTVVYLLVAAGALGTTPYTQLIGNNEPLAFVLRNMGHTTIGNLVALAAIFALPTVVMMMMYGQSRIFFVMARDGLLPKVFSNVHPRFKTPHVITIVTGVLVALISGFFSVDEIAELSNSGTLFAFIAVAIGVMVLRKTQPNRPRPFKCPAVYVVGTLAVLGCLGLMVSLPTVALVRFALWTVIGGVVYALYGFRASPMHKSS
jgi:APA family basic amino acid/polyamine antiporter